MPPPGPWGWSNHPKKKKRKGKKRKMGWGLLGVAEPPSGLGWLRPPHTAGMGWPKPPPGPWGRFGHPQKPKTHFLFFLAIWGWPDHPQAWGWSGHPQTSRTTLAGLGVVEPPPWPWGWFVQPCHHCSLSLFFFFFFFFRF
jgi:hypothetical protein